MNGYPIEIEEADEERMHQYLKAMKKRQEEWDMNHLR